MAISRLGRTVAALSGVVALAAAVTWFGILEPQRQRASGPAGVGPGGQPAAPEAPVAPSPLAGAPAEPGTAPAPPPPAPPEALAPSFDIVRVEPTGESVIAGRAAPGSTVELLRDGKPHARTLSDGSGLFAFVPPPFPPGSQEIVLQATAPDGTRTRSRESVTVAVAERRDVKPLIALTTPDKPTVILSSPDSPAPAPAEAKAAEPQARTAALPDAAKPDAGAARPPAPQARPDAAPIVPVPGAAAPPVPAAGPRAQVRIASVEAEEGGRLFVSGQAAPGATVRLYLNDTLIAPGGAGTDGRVSFAIGRGVRPGGYRVRLDDVDPVSGEVKSRAEVEFRMPAPLAVELPPSAEPLVTNLPPAPRAAEERAVATAPSTLPSGRAPSAPASPPAAPAPQPPAGPAVTAPSPPTPSPPAAARSPAVAAAPDRTASAEAAAPSPEPPRAAPRELDPGTVLVPEINTAIVSRGDNLWRISKRVYGRGVRYTVIYRANEEQIRSPRLIYPGQVFVLPPEGSARP
ncbi:MAG TPA: LysM peptidoglycan-binding domain-containing protein [Beijerinckiaceae bacterium]|jgi:nucleoid-associated protein YgaU